MNGVDFDLHSQILMGLAEVLADSRSKATSSEIDKLISKCPPVPIPDDNDKNIFTRDQKPDLGAMTSRSQQSLAALVKYAVNASEERQLELLPRLLAYVRHLPAYEWKEVMLGKGVPPSDAITYSLVSGLLEIGFKIPDTYRYINDILWSYGESIIEFMKKGDVEFTVSFILPSLAGLSRALQLSPFLYRPNQLLALCHNTQFLIQDETLDNIRSAITACLKDHDPLAYSRRVLNKYWEDGVPLSSNRVVHDLLIILRNVTARVIADSRPDAHTQAPSPAAPKKLHLTRDVEQAWTELMRKTASGVRPTAPTDVEKDELLNKNMRSVYVTSLGYYEDIKKFADKSTEDGNKWAPDAYMHEIMGTSLHVAALSSVYLHEVDDVLIDHISECLFAPLHGNDPWVHVAALDAAVLLAINFSHLNSDMTNAICRFLATPSPVFELQAEESITVQQFAIVRLAQCVQLPRPLSPLYAANGDRFSVFGKNVISGAPDADQLSEKQKQQVCANALSAIVGVAVYLKDDAIMAQALSMLVMRRKSLSIASTASLTSKLVDLALVSPPSVFGDILHFFSTLSREALTIDNKQLTTAQHVLTFHAMQINNAQLNLASRLSAKPDYYQIYLLNLLTLFVENGNTIQRTMTKNKKEAEYPLASKLGMLLPVLRTLLEHEDFNPHLDPSEEAVSLFRNAWFHCVLFGFVTESVWIREWHDSLLVIAKKTPVLVTESATNYIESDLEYNSVLRGGNMAEHNLSSMRQRLTSYLPSLSYDIKGFSFAQVVFSLSFYHIEMMRSKMGDCSYVLRYFMNDGINNSSLANCLETITDRVVGAFVKDSASKASVQGISAELSEQMASILKLTCHRLKKVHELAIKSAERIVAAFPQVFAEKSLITLLLELVQLLWLSCESEYREEYSPVFHFTSPRVNVTLELGDSYAYRHEICTRLYESAKKWLHISMDRAPLEINGLLQDYLSEFDRFSSGQPIDAAHMGRSLALEIGKSASKNQLSVEFVPRVPRILPDESSDFVSGFTSRRFYIGEISGIEYLSGIREQTEKLPDAKTGSGLSEQVAFVLENLEALLVDIKQKHHVSVERVHRTLHRAAAYAIALPKIHPDLIRYLVRIPVHMFTPESLDIGTTVWNWMLVERADVEKRLMVEMLSMWHWAQKHRKGLFSPVLNSKHPFVAKMTNDPSDKAVCDSNHRVATFLFTPHQTWIKFLSSRFYSIRHRSRHLVNMFVRLLQESFQNGHLMSTHALARPVRFQLLLLGTKILQSTRMEALAEHKFRSLVYECAFNWFSLEPRWHYGSRKSLALMEYKILTDFYNAVVNDTPNLSYLVTSSPLKNSNSKIASGLYMFLNDKTKDDVIRQHHLAKKLLMLFLESELTRLSVWCNPLNSMGHGNPACFTGSTEKSMVMEESWKEIVRFAWELSPRLAVQMNARFVQPIVHRELHRLIANNTLDVVDVPEALVILLGDRLVPNAKLDLKHLQYWAPVPAITAANYFLPAYNNNPLILQYAMRSLEYYPVDTVFFYIPQIVQALRHDELGYVEKYIMEAGQVSQLFAHQIIWNMKANFFVDADKECLKPDALKPTLERIIESLVNSFTGEDREFYEREFKFFKEVTAISGYLKEYIKYGQTEKKPLQKKRLDEELAKIKVDVGVYLPSNSDGRVIDINRTSGRPLQSHAKAPFMATFKIEKDVEDTDLLGKAMIESEDGDEVEAKKRTVQIWQGAIFKVGDDCRQDVLALQLISVFKNIFTGVGMDLYVYPYRVVATAPGQGVIDVIPRSISRDQLGREKVNSMYDYFVAKYGGPHSIHFQRARNNFVQSLAAYSVISYVLAIKDRHNGNIMLDDDGHIIHIDFGFIFDIAPGGITFESSPFKLTTEMIQVMGGASDEQAFRQFSELVVKAYLASRPYADQICQIVTLMLDSGLPCFKGETIKRLRQRFQLDRSERQAADYIMMRIRDSFENQRTVLYDYFQKLTNGIPY
ncbi:hypothetical protein BJV82DRAFT_642239 [Fennellomyces sp. T-0311]|nr:hypothetical protein BJV82DRAFT_642239 [Fennellomyces sp. T-0311]